MITSQNIMKSVLLKCQPSRASHTQLQYCAFTLLNNRSIQESFHFTECNYLTYLWLYMLFCTIFILGLYRTLGKIVTQSK